MVDAGVLDQWVHVITCFSECLPGGVVRDCCDDRALGAVTRRHPRRMRFPA
jgi:hypothetical protein